MPLSFEEIKSLTFVYCPSVVPVTVTSKVQLPSAASDPPDNAIVLVAALVVSVPPHWVVELSAIDRPAGNTSVKAMPVNA